MKQKEEKTKKPETLEDKKITQTSFILVFPAIIVAIIAVAFLPANEWWVSLIVIAMEVYHLLMVRKFVEEHYHRVYA